MKKSTFKICAGSNAYNVVDSVWKDIGLFVMKRCANSNINSIFFFGFYFDEAFISENEETFKSLESLVVYYGRYMATSEGAYPQDCLFKLLEGSTIKKFIFRPEREFKCKGFSLSFNLLTLIATSQLEKCFISTPFLTFDSGMVDIPENYSLKQLGLKGVLFDTAILLRFQAIEHLSLICSNISVTLETVTDMPNLQHLNLNLSPDFSHLSMLLSRLSNRNMLKSLTLTIRLMQSNESGLTDEQLPELEDQLANNLCGMTNLTHLKLTTYLNMHRHFSEIGRRLINLKGFSFRKLFLTREKTSYAVRTKIEHWDQKHQFFNEALKLAEVAKNLNFLELKPLPDSQHFYDVLVEIRQMQEMPQETLLVPFEYIFAPDIIATHTQERFVKGNNKINNRLNNNIIQTIAPKEIITKLNFF